MKKLLFSFVLLLLLVSMGSTADVYNTGVIYGYPNNIPATGNVVAYWEDYSHVTYFWRFTWVDSSNNAHSKPLYIGNCNVSDGYVYVKQSATGDANIFFHYAADNRNTYQVGTTPADLDACSNTAKVDTIGIEETVDEILFHAARWVVIEAASGSSSNQDGNIITVILKFKKETPTAVKSNGDYARLARVASGSKTNP